MRGFFAEQVCNPLGSKAVIIESYDKSWRCLILPERSLLSHNTGWLFQELSPVFVNATLIDASASVQVLVIFALLNSLTISIFSI